jgi:hypothetical protein
MRLSRRRKGISALFDAIMFFVIIAVASAALFFSASRGSSAMSEDASTRHLGQQAADIQSTALECTLGPLNYSVNGSGLTFNGNLLECVHTVLRVQAQSANCTLDPLRDAVKGTYGLLVERPFHFAVRAAMTGPGGERYGALFVSDKALTPADIGEVRWTSNVPFVLDEKDGELTLFLWR